MMAISRYAMTLPDQPYIPARDDLRTLWTITLRGTGGRATIRKDTWNRYTVTTSASISSTHRAGEAMRWAYEAISERNAQ